MAQSGFPIFALFATIAIAECCVPSVQSSLDYRRRVKINHKPLLKNHYIQRNSLFGALYGPAESLVHMSSKTRMGRMLQSTVNGIETWLLTFSYLNSLALIFLTCGFNRTEPHATQRAIQLIYSKKHLVNE